MNFSADARCARSSRIGNCGRPSFGASLPHTSSILNCVSADSPSSEMVVNRPKNPLLGRRNHVLPAACLALSVRRNTPQWRSYANESAIIPNSPPELWGMPHEKCFIVALLLFVTAIVRTVTSTAAALQHESPRSDWWNFVVFHSGLLRVLKPSSQ